jgi:hypothetical protein
MAKAKTKPPQRPEAAPPALPLAEKNHAKRDGQMGQALESIICAVCDDRLARQAIAQSVNIVSVTVPAGTTLVKDIVSDPADPNYSVFDMTNGPMTVAGVCLNLVTGDVLGELVGLDTNLIILQTGATTYSGAGSRRWSLTIPNTPQPAAGNYAVILQVCFSTGGPTDSVSFSVTLPAQPPPPPVPVPGGP